MPILLVALTVTQASSVRLAASSEAAAPILLYHRFDLSVPGSTTVTTPVFEEQLDWLADHHYTVVPLSRLVAAMRSDKPLDALSVAITVDDGRRSQYLEMFPIILRRRVPVTLFLYTDAISVEPDALTWDQVDEMLRSGLVDIGSHTCSHPNFEAERARRSAADYEAFAFSELQRSRRILTDRLGRSIDMVAWPYGILDPILVRTAVRTGYRAGFAVGGRLLSANDDPFAIPRVIVTDGDRGARFGRLLQHGRSPVSAFNERDDMCD